MDPSDLRPLYAYLEESRRRFLAAFRRLGWDAVKEDRGGTWGSLHGIFVHMLEVEDSWLHYDIPGTPWPHGDRPPEAFGAFEAVEAYDREVVGRTRALLARLTREELTREVDVEGWGEMRVETILLHVFVDEVAHIGELVYLFWQRDVKPPFLNRGGLPGARGRLRGTADGEGECVGQAFTLNTNLRPSSKGAGALIDPSGAHSQLRLARIHGSDEIARDYLEHVGAEGDGPLPRKIFGVGGDLETPAWVCMNRRNFRREDLDEALRAIGRT